uniref:EGF-like domain-containing protein n=1 Tax=Caenorhabditis tropicalis TaxID=1561998 RepID=A0A1I7TVQ4_9PELO
MFVKSSSFVLFLLFATWIHAEEEMAIYDEVEDISNNRTISGEVEISDVEADDKEKTDKKRAVDEGNEIQEEVKAELDKAVESLKEAAKEREEEENGLLSPSNLESCGPIDCNHRGTCLGSKKTFFCACQLGFSGKTCEETVCDSARDCNGRGLCFGTTNQLTCLCNLGFTGKRCQTAI